MFHSNSTSGSVLKIKIFKCGIWNRINELHVYYYLNTHWSTLHFEWFFYIYAWFCSIMYCSSGKYWFIPSPFRFSKCWPISLRNIKASHLVLSPPGLSEKVCEVLGSCQRYHGRHWFSKIQFFFLKAWISTQGTSVVSCFLGETSSPCFKRKCLPTTWDWTTCPLDWITILCLPTVPSSTNGVLWKCRLGQHATQAIAEPSFPWNSQQASVCSQRAVWALLILHTEH